jgi:predicted transcriptional regulator YheO
MPNILKEITTVNDQTLACIKDDPVRPHIPAPDRVHANKKVFYLTNENNDVLAMVCIAFTDQVATTEQELDRFMTMENTSVVMFYTIWSYATGAGRELALTIIDHVKNNFSNISRIVTLSPKTEMARRFHIKNGAFELQENPETVNFEYLLNK